MYKPEVEKRIIPENNLLRNAVFDEEFQGEQLVTEGKTDFLKEKYNTYFHVANVLLA